MAQVLADQDAPAVIGGDLDLDLPRPAGPGGVVVGEDSVRFVGAGQAVVAAQPRVEGGVPGGLAGTVGAIEDVQPLVQDQRLVAQIAEGAGPDPQDAHYASPASSCPRMASRAIRSTGRRSSGSRVASTSRRKADHTALRRSRSSSTSYQSWAAPASSASATQAGGSSTVDSGGSGSLADQSRCATGSGLIAHRPTTGRAGGAPNRTGPPPGRAAEDQKR